MKWTIVEPKSSRAIQKNAKRVDPVGAVVFCGVLSLRQEEKRPVFADVIRLLFGFDDIAEHDHMYTAVASKYVAEMWYTFSHTSAPMFL